MSLNIQRNDQVEVIAGSDRGKRGRVLRVLADENRVLVEHVRMIKKNVRPNPQRNIKGGIAEQEGPGLQEVRTDARRKEEVRTRLAAQLTTFRNGTRQQSHSEDRKRKRNRN